MFRETFEKCFPLTAGFKAKEGKNLALKSFTAYNHRNTLSLLRIALKLHCVPKFEPDAGIGQKGAFCKGLSD